MDDFATMTEQLEQWLTRMDNAVAERRKLRNGLRRQWRRLARAALPVVKQEGYRVISPGEFTVESPMPPTVDGITRFWKTLVGEDEFLALAKEDMPSLYRRFLEGERRHEQLRADLEGMLEIVRAFEKTSPYDQARL